MSGIEVLLNIMFLVFILLSFNSPNIVLSNGVL